MPIFASLSFFLACNFGDDGYFHAIETQCQLSAALVSELASLWSFARQPNSFRLESNCTIPSSARRLLCSAVHTLFVPEAASP